MFFCRVFLPRVFVSRHHNQEGCRPSLKTRGHETVSCTLPDASPVFQDHGVVIIILTIIISIVDNIIFNMIVIPLLFKSRDFLGTQITHSGQKNKKCRSPYLVSAKTLKKRLQSVIQYSSILLSFSSLSGRPKYMSILSINDTKLMLLVAGWLSTADSDSNNFASSS